MIIHEYAQDEIRYSSIVYKNQISNPNLQAHTHKNTNDAYIHAYTMHTQRIENEILQHLSDGKRGETLRSGLQCSLVGPPNAGKSSLLNFLAARPAAIVSSIPGTTRDIVQVNYSHVLD